jgi:hypothetical protein
MTNVATRPPLEPGTEIEFCGRHATVVHDDGGKSLDILRDDGAKDRWWWQIGDKVCQVVSH